MTFGAHPPDPSTVTAVADDDRPMDDGEADVPVIDERSDADVTDALPEDLDALSRLSPTGMKGPPLGRLPFFTTVRSPDRPGRPADPY